MKWILILLVVCSCATAKTKQSAPQVSIHDIYVLAAVQGKIIEEEMKNQSTLEINLTEMQMIGNDGCNNFSGKITQHNPDKQQGPRLFGCSDLEQEYFADGAPQRVDGFLAASHDPGLGVRPQLEVLGKPVLEITGR